MFQKLMQYVAAFFTSPAPKHVIEVRAAVVSALTELHVKAESQRDSGPINPIKIPVTVMAVAKRLRDDWREGKADARFTKTMMGWVKKAHPTTGYTVYVQSKGTTYCVRLDW